MWRREEEQVKEEKALHMTSHEGSQRKDVLSLKKERLLVLWKAWSLEERLLVSEE